MYVNTLVRVLKVPPGGCETERRGKEGDRGKIKWKLSEVNTRTVSRGQNEFIGKFKMAAIEGTRES